ncbi:1-deoxypentalenic acid 11-beta-hydroxylase-like [Haliotis cracherodii]|uniref:1-deoxypentalenic acid 11-beta-hydroxylase-like n=1 Tax=Haliotis cracherodii TaxID=6455 RepID=UPI0039E867D4
MATREVKLGTRTVQFPSTYLQELQDCNDKLDDVDALHKELDDKGYLFIRGLHDREEVLAARLAVLQYLKDQGEGILHPSEPVEKGVLQQGCGVGCVPTMEGVPSITHRDPVKAVIEGPRPFSFFKKFFGKDVTTLDFKWLRAVPTDAFTGVHVDSVYMSRGSQSLLTMWTPVGDISIEMGVLAMCEGSHQLPGFAQFQNTYGNLDAEEARLKGTGWFTTDPFEITDKFGGQWKTTDFKAGDVMVFGMRTVHMSTCNLTNLARISCDTRWQPSDEPADSRYMEGSEGPELAFGLHAKDESSASETTMESLRLRWGL